MQVREARAVNHELETIPGYRSLCESLDWLENVINTRLDSLDEVLKQCIQSSNELNDQCHRVYGFFRSMLQVMAPDQLERLESRSVSSQFVIPFVLHLTDTFLGTQLRSCSTFHDTLPDALRDTKLLPDTLSSCD
ncbi:hypothetical protein DACRYDRAFT_24368, partial [Dacryopinax primogenitus]